MECTSDLKQDWQARHYLRDLPSKSTRQLRLFQCHRSFGPRETIRCYNSKLHHLGFEALCIYRWFRGSLFYFAGQREERCATSPRSRQPTVRHAPRKSCDAFPFLPKPKTPAQVVRWRHDTYSVVLRWPRYDAFPVSLSASLPPSIPGSNTFLCDTHFCVHTRLKLIFLHLSGIAHCWYRTRNNIGGNSKDFWRVVYKAYTQ
jgi:hypothetical protein